jgi:hypothetical protein
MKKIELLIEDYEYAQIEEIFENEDNFEPIHEKDRIIIKALRGVINKDNIVEENVGGERSSTTKTKSKATSK